MGHNVSSAKESVFFFFVVVIVVKSPSVDAMPRGLSFLEFVENKASCFLSAVSKQNCFPVLNCYCLQEQGKITWLQKVKDLPPPPVPLSKRSFDFFFFPHFPSRECISFITSVVSRELWRWENIQRLLGGPVVAGHGWRV